MVDIRRVPVGPFRVVDASADKVTQYIAEMAANPGDRVRTAYALHVGGLNNASTPAYVAALQKADVVYADGSAVVHLARIAGAEQIERAPTTDIGLPVISCLAGLLARPPRVVLVGGPPGLAERAGGVVSSRTEATVVLTAPGFDQDEEALARRIRQVSPDLLVVGMGVPVETLWAERMKDRLDPLMIVTCGGWFGFLTGDEHRAPRWMQPNFEWLHRLALSPRRLLPRYARAVVSTAVLLPHQWRVRRRRDEPEDGHVSSYQPLAEESEASRGTRRLLVISSTRWEYLWQRHQALSVAAAEAGWQVDFKQPSRRSFRGIVPSLWRKLVSTLTRHTTGAVAVSPPRQPVPGIRILGPHERTARGYDLALVYVPIVLTEWLLDYARPRSIIYDAVVDWGAVPDDWHPPVGWPSSERRLAARRNAVVTTDAPGMQQILAGRGIPSHVVYPAADPAFLAIDRDNYDQRQARALYFGAIREEVDLDILFALRDAGIGVDLVGPVDDPALQEELGQRGLTVSPQLPVDEVAALVGTYRVLLLPYRGARAGSIMPAKFWNCVASGAWVVTSGLSHTPDLPCVVQSDQGTVVETVQAAFAHPPQTGAGQLPTWSERWSEMCSLARTR